MTSNEFADLLDRIQSEEKQVRRDGQLEYARDLDNCFANFERLALSLDGVFTREDILIVYAFKHWDGIMSYIRGHKSQREDVRGRIKDLRMYLALLWGMIEDSEKSKLQVQESESK